MRHRVGQVKTVNVGLVNPALQLIGHGLRAAHQQRTKPTDPHPVSQRLHRPLAVGIGRREGLNRRLNGIGMQMLQNLIGLVLAEVNAGPAGDQRQRPLIADVAFVLLPFGLRRFIRLIDNHRLQVKDQDAARVTPGRCGTLTNICHGFFQQNL